MSFKPFMLGMHALAALAVAWLSSVSSLYAEYIHIFQENLASPGCASTKAMADAVAGNGAAQLCLNYCASQNWSVGQFESICVNDWGTSGLNSSGKFRESHDDVPLPTGNVVPSTVDIDAGDACPTAPVDPDTNNGEVEWCTVWEYRCSCLCTFYSKPFSSAFRGTLNEISGH